MTLTSSQFHAVRNNVGDIGLFGIIIAWEHVMLLIKYLMQSHSCPYPPSVVNAMKKEEYLKTRLRTSHLRAKKERRSFHYARPSCVMNSKSTISTSSNEMSPKKSTISETETSTQEMYSGSTDSDYYSDETSKVRNHEIVDVTESCQAKESSKLRQRHRRKDRTGNKYSEMTDYMGGSTVTPKQTIGAGAVASSISPANDSFSPFKMYFPSEFKDDTGHTLAEDEYSLSDILSINSDSYDSYTSVSTSMPSMSRVKKQRENAEEINTAKKRIHHRLSSIGGRRKEKKKD